MSGLTDSDCIPIPYFIKCTDPNYANESHANYVNKLYYNVNKMPSKYKVPALFDHVDSFHGAA